MNHLPDHPPMAALQNPIQWVEYIGPIIAQSRMFGCQNEAQGKVLASMQITQGVALMDIMRTYHFVDGKLSMRAEAMLATFRDKYGGQHVVLRRDPEAAGIRLVDRHGVVTERFITWEEIKNEPFTKGKNGQVKDNYATPHKRMQMLWARLVSDAVRAVEPGVVAGAYTPEEISDFGQGSGTSASLVESAEVTPTPQQAQPQTQQQTQLTAPADAKPVYSWRDTDPATPETITEIRKLIGELSQHDPGIVERLKKVLEGMGKKLDQLNHGEALAMKSRLSAKLTGTRF